MGILHFAHPLPPPRLFCGRAAELAELARRRKEGGFVCLVGIGGAGKSALLAGFLSSLVEPMPDGLVWSFYVQADAAAMLAALHEALHSESGESVFNTLQERPGFILVLDGFERMQAAEAPHAIVDPSLQRFLERFASLGKGSLCICASRLPLGLGVTVPVDGLAVEDAVALLRLRGLQGSEETLRDVARQYDGHPLTLSLVAGAVTQFLSGDPSRHGDVGPTGAAAAPWMGDVEAALTRVLGFYRERLSPQAAALLARLSLFPGPADERILQAVFLEGTPTVAGELRGLTAAQLREALEELDALALVEHVDETLWVAHAVVRDFFPPTLVDPKGIHYAVAHFLGDRPASSSGRPGRAERNALEEAIDHAQRADADAFALDLYSRRLGAAEWLVECGDLARGERIVRSLLEKGSLAEEHGARLQNELAILLDHLGRLEEASALYWRAFRKRAREGRWDDACRILLRLAHNALWRGRLPLAGKLTRVAGEMASRFNLPPGYAAPQLLGDFSRTHQEYVEHRRTGGGPRPEVWKDKHTAAETTAAVDVLMRLGFPDEAYRAADAVVAGNRIEAPATALLAVLERTIAFFRRESARPEMLPSQVASRILRQANLRETIDIARLSGRLPLLAKALTFRAHLHRLLGDTSSALNDLEEAEEICRTHGLLLRLIDALLESRHYFGAGPVTEALGIASRPDVDDGWSATAARTWLALHERVSEGAALETAFEAAMEKLTAEVCAGRATVSASGTALACEDLEVACPLLGVDPLEARIAIPGPDGIALVVPVEAAFRDQVDALRDEAEDAALYDRYRQFWMGYYESQMRDREQIGPTYHLAVLLRLEGHTAHAAAVADDLLACRPPFPGAASLAVACAPNVGKALEVLREADPGTPTVAYNLGLLHEHQGHLDEARRAYERALRVDRWSREARMRLRNLDEAAETREKCRRVLRQAVHAAQAWHQAVGGYPAALAELSRGLMRTTPTCPDGARAYEYRLARSGDRALLTCRTHRLRVDSRRGDLTPAAPVGLPDAATVRFFRRVAEVGEALDRQGIRLFVTAHRGLRIVE